MRKVLLTLVFFLPLSAASARMPMVAIPPAYFGFTTGVTGIFEERPDEPDKNPGLEAGLSGSILFLLSGHAGAFGGYNIGSETSYAVIYGGVGFLMFLVDFGTYIPLSDSTSPGFLTGISVEWPFERRSTLAAIQGKVWYVNVPDSSTTYYDQVNIGITLIWDPSRMGP